MREASKIITHQLQEEFLVYIHSFTLFRNIFQMNLLNKKFYCMTNLYAYLNLEPIAVSQSTTPQEENKIRKLNDATAEIVNSYHSYKKNLSSEPEIDQASRQLKWKMDSVLQNWANQYLVSKEIYTEKPVQNKPSPHNYKIGHLPRCSFCKLVFANEELLITHVQIKHSAFRSTERRTFVCNYCHKNCENFNNLQKHIDIRHTNSKDKSSEIEMGKKCVCLLCKQLFKDETELSKHFSKCGMQDLEIHKVKVKRKDNLNTFSNNKYVGDKLATIGKGGLPNEATIGKSGLPDEDKQKGEVKRNDLLYIVLRTKTV